MTIRGEGTRIPIRRRRGDQVQSEDELRAGHPEPEVTAEVAYAAADAREPGPVADEAVGQAADVDWRDVALRLKADMENFRRRQIRRADGEALQEKERLLGQFLRVLDDMEVALEHLKKDDAVHQGVRVAFDAMLAMMLREGVERIFAKGKPFDPMRHDAVAVVPAAPDAREELRVVEVTSPGYMLGDRVLRPAKVVVAKRGA
jgi:molecular chaperone GrpE